LNYEKVFNLSLNLFPWVKRERIWIVVSSSVFKFPLLNLNLSEGIKDLFAILVTKYRVDNLAVSPGRKIGHLSGTLQNGFMLLTNEGLRSFLKSKLFSKLFYLVVFVLLSST